MSDKSQSVWYKNALLNNCIVDIEVRDGKFGFIGKNDEKGINLCGKAVFPGLIDIHCHGAIGYDSIEETHLEEMSIYFAKRGVTTWYPTLSTSKERLLQLLKRPLDGMRGANMPGYHLEGPYLSPKALGACELSTLKKPDLSDFAGFDNIKLITIAPELEGAMEYIQKTDAKVALGHTTAGYDLAVQAIEAGASSLTHTFNAMTPLHHRNPGVIGAAIEKDIFVQVISDGIHLHKSIVTALYRIFGKKMILISDAVAGAGLPNGTKFEMCGSTCVVNDGTIRNAEGALAGSASDLYRNVQTAISFGIPREDAFYMASTAPAIYMGIKKGKIETGYDADFLVVDENNELLTTVIGGEIFEL